MGCVRFGSNQGLSRHSQVLSVRFLSLSQTRPTKPRSATFETRSNWRDRWKFRSSLRSDWCSLVGYAPGNDLRCRGSPGHTSYDRRCDLSASTPTVDRDLAGVGPASKAGRPPLMIRCCEHNRRSDGGPGHSVAVDPACWQAGLEELLGRVAGRFGRVEPRWRARALVLGLLADLPRKNCWTLAEHAGDPSPDGLQHLLGRAVWDEDGVRDD